MSTAAPPVPDEPATDHSHQWQSDIYCSVCGAEPAAPPVPDEPHKHAWEPIWACSGCSATLDPTAPVADCCCDGGGSIAHVHDDSRCTGGHTSACERTTLALAICDSEAFMWLMAGSNHIEMNLNILRPAWKRYRDTGGGWGMSRPAPPAALGAVPDEEETPDYGDVSDGFGSTWVRCGPDCTLEVVRPGKAQCGWAEGLDYAPCEADEEETP